ncbi:MAG: helix-hairpin-helix domain-containing protein, partial [Bdellovibrionales bacterium]
GFQKSAYRKFNIREADASDDYGMMREVMRRRFRNVTPEDPQFPDILLIDGGRGQLSAVREVLEDLGLFDALCVVAISKGPDRNAGREEFHIEGRPTFTLPHNDLTLHMLQNLRDEAHRFAIGSHRGRRQKSALRSSLDEIDGIGPKKKKALLHHFGSAEAVKNAAIDDLKSVEGISSKIAEKIYYSFHDDT